MSSTPNPPDPTPVPEPTPPPSATPPPPLDPAPASGAEAPPPPPAELSGFAKFMNRTPSPVIASTKDERLWATLIHLSGILGCVTAVIHIPGGNLLLPLILWLVKRNGSAFVDDQGKEAVNFQIVATIAALVGIVLMFVCIGFILMPLLGLYVIGISIYAAIKANDGVAFRHPLTFRLIK
jgi:hypothetical protein